MEIHFERTEKSKDIHTSPVLHCNVKHFGTNDMSGWVDWQMLIYAIIIECYANLVMHVTTTTTTMANGENVVNERRARALAKRNPMSETIPRYAERLLFPVANNKRFITRI